MLRKKKQKTEHRVMESANTYGVTHFSDALSCDKCVADRLKKARTALGLKQEEMATQSGVSPSAYQKYELGRSVPGGDAIAGFVRLGVNANWLLTGEGEMLLRDMRRQDTASALNVEALAMILAGILQGMGDRVDPVRAATKALQYYQDAIDEGLITPAGVGKGGGKAA